MFLVHAGASWGWSGSFGIGGFKRVRPRVVGGHSGSLGSRGCALGVVGGRRVHADALWGSSAPSEARCVHTGAPGGGSGSFGVVGFTRVRSGGRWVLSGVSSGSFGVLGRSVHSDAPWGSWV